MSGGARLPAVSAQCRMAGARLIPINKISLLRHQCARPAPIERHNVMNKFESDHPDRMRKKALELRERARLAEVPGYAEQLILAAEDLENYALQVEGRSRGNARSTTQG